MSLQFFKNVDATGIVERHSRRINGIEVMQAKHLLKEYIIARKEIVERLQTVIAGTFTEAQLKTALAQIEAAILNLTRRTGSEIELGSNMVSEQGIEDLIKEIKVFSKKFEGIEQEIPLSLVLSSMQPENYLINNYASSIDRYNQQLRSNIQRELTQSIIQRDNSSRTIMRVENLMVAEEWQVARIVRTELHQMFNIAKMNGMNELSKDYMVDLKKTLIHPMDMRTGKDSKVLARLNPIIDIDKPFKYTFRQGKQDITRTFMAPPDRPNDRAVLVPYRLQWDKEVG